MNRSVALAAIALIGLATPALSQGRFGDEAAQRAAARTEREAIRRAEHRELYQPVAGQPAQATARAAVPPPAPAAEPETAPVPETETETVPAPAAAPAQ